MSRDFYDITHEGERLRLPRVTSILGVIDKSGPLMGWAVKCERLAFQAALEEVLTQPGIAESQDIYQRVMRAVSGQRASVREQERAANIGLEAHRLIEWHIHKLLGQPLDEEPKVSDPALRAVLAWLDWCRMVDFTPLEAERIVYCPACGFAGTLDCIAKVLGRVTVIDWKTGKAVYPEAFLQNLAYRHAALAQGVQTDGGLVLRLPKAASDPLPEAVPVPELPYRDFLAAKVLWMWQRKMNQEPYGPEISTCPIRSHR